MSATRIAIIREIHSEALHVHHARSQFEVVCVFETNSLCDAQMMLDDARAQAPEDRFSIYLGLSEASGARRF